MTIKTDPIPQNEPPADPVYHCERCGRPLRPGNIVWLALDSSTGEYHADEVPEAVNQGAFPFGPDCAPKVWTIYR